MATDPTSPVALVSVPSEFEAGIIANALRDNGISATTTGAYTSGFKAEAPGEVMVLVPVAELDEAKQALADIRRGQADIDWSNVDVGTPE